MVDFGIDMALVVVVIIIVEVVKGLGLNKRFLPIVSIALGIAISFLQGGIDTITILQHGVIIGAMAVGLYDGTKVVFSHDKENMQDVEALFPTDEYFDNSLTIEEVDGDDLGIDNGKEFEEVKEGYYVNNSGKEIKDTK